MHKGCWNRLNSYSHPYKPISALKKTIRKPMECLAATPLASDQASAASLERLKTCIVAEVEGSILKAKQGSMKGSVFLSGLEL